MDMGPTSGLKFHKGEPRKPTKSRARLMKNMDWPSRGGCSLGGSAITIGKRNGGPS